MENVYLIINVTLVKPLKDIQCVPQTEVGDSGDIRYPMCMANRGGDSGNIKVKPVGEVISEILLL